MKSVPVKWTLGIAALALFLCPVSAQSTQSEYASTVINYSGGSGSNNNPNNILGNHPGNYAGIGDCGQITVGFSDAFTTTGNSTSDLDVDEYSDNDCWWVCLKPADQFTLNAIQNAGWQQYGQYYQIPTTYCGNDWVDIDHFLPGFQAGDLKFSEFMIEDDCNGSDGAEIMTVWCRNVCTTPPPPPPPPTLPNCVEGYGAHVISYHKGSGANDPWPNNALGNNSSTYVGLGIGGNIKLAFADNFVNGGDSAVDLEVMQWGNPDCYDVRVKPGNIATSNALNNAGLSLSGGFYTLLTACGNASIDIDAIVTGASPGSLLFSEVCLDDANGGNGSAEIISIRAPLVCTPPPPPPTLPDCAPGFASSVLMYTQGNNASGSTDPNDALGDTPNTRVGLGNNGKLDVGFGNPIANGGNGAADLLVDEFGIVDCYNVALSSNDPSTQAVLANSGWNEAGGFYQIPATYCGDNNIDFDSLLPGNAGGSLLFNAVRIMDDGTASDGSEIVRVRAEYVCNVPVCVPEFASRVLNVTPGANAALDPTNALGDTPNTTYRVGRMGCITLGFSNVFTTTGDGDADFNIDEDAGAECYYLDFRAATSGTANALANAGWVQQPNGMYRAPMFYCGDVSVDLDAMVPGGQSEGDLRFRSIRICDQSNSGTGADITRVEATRVCPDIASVGDYVWVDANGNGLQDAAEVNVPGVIVKLYDATGTTVLDETVTDAFGRYLFSVDPGQYVIGFEFDDNLYFVTSKNSGTDPEIDSDVNAGTNLTDVFTVAPGTNRRDIDLGLAFVCVGVTASAVTLNPACSVPNEPQLTVTQPAIGLVSTIAVTSNFPNARVFLLLSMGAPVPFSIPGTTCNTYIDFTQMYLLLEADTDANGNWTFDLPLPVEPNLIGVNLTLQARVCLPSIPGPIPGFPDWLTNGVFVTFGCP